MNAAIRYYTRSGNTEKLARAISEALNLPAESVEIPLTERTDILFLGCSYYAFDMDRHVKDFLRSNADKIGQVVCFGTSAMIKSMKKPMKKVLNELGIPMAEDEFHCYGSFGFMHMGRPDANDLKAVGEFAIAVAEKMK